MAKRTKVTKREIDLATGVVLGHIIYDAMSDLTRMIIADELRWITIHPNGKGAKLSNGEENVKGKPVLIDTETGKIVGGAIPQSLHGVKLQSKEEREKNGSKSFKEIIKEGQNQTNAPDNNTSGSNNTAGATIDPNSDPVSYARDPNADYSKINTLKGRHAFLQERVKNAKSISYDSSEAECKEYLKAVLPQTQCHIFKDFDAKSVAHIAVGASKFVESFPMMGELFNSLQDRSSYEKNLKVYEKELNKNYHAAKKKLEENLEKALTDNPSVKAYADKTKANFRAYWFGEDGKFRPNLSISTSTVKSLSKGTKEKLADFLKKNGLPDAGVWRDVVSSEIVSGSKLNQLAIPKDLIDSIKADIDKEAINKTKRDYRSAYKDQLDKLKAVKVTSIYSTYKWLSKKSVNGFCTSRTPEQNAGEGIRTTVKPLNNNGGISNIILHKGNSTQTGLDSDVQGKWSSAHASKYSRLVHTTVHEMAHALHNMIDPDRFDKNSTIKAMFDDYCKRELGQEEAAKLERLRAKGEDVTNKIKSYKFYDSGEYFAEMLTESLLSDNPCQEALKVRDYATMLYNNYIK